jgi:hypothetical protein
VQRITVGGAFVSFQDSLWYPRRSPGSLAVERGAYLLWRMGQGQLWRGVASVLRRRRGAYDETDPSDMIEYHVVRKGVDELRASCVAGTIFPCRGTEALLVDQLGMVAVRG